MTERGSVVGKRDGFGIGVVCVGRSDGQQSLVAWRQAKMGVEDSSLVRKRKCCLVESIVSLVGGRRAKTSVVGQGDGQQQYYLKLLKSLIARLREMAFKYIVLSNYGNDYW